MKKVLKSVAVTYHLTHQEDTGLYVYQAVIDFALDHKLQPQKKNTTSYGGSAIVEGYTDQNVIAALGNSKIRTVKSLVCILEPKDLAHVEAVQNLGG